VDKRVKVHCIDDMKLRWVGKWTWTNWAHGQYGMRKWKT